jgi:CPA1 family monovalent cation:H+ antiporter
MDALATTTVSLLMVAIFVALIAQRLNIPYTVGLVATGIGLAYTRDSMGVALTHDFILDVILPPLLFEAAINLHWKELRRDALPVFVLAFFGTLIATGAVTTGMMLTFNWPLIPALLFGSLIAATDPVAVIAMFKDNGVTGRSRFLVESESLFNDGVAAVLFTLVLQWSQATDEEALHSIDVVNVLAVTIGGGVAAGIACAGAAIALAWRTADHLIESTLTTIAAYGSFLIAEHFHCSGILATVTAGLLLANLAELTGRDQPVLTARGQEFVPALWEFIAFIANSLVFLLIGLTVAGIPFDLFGAWPLAVVIILALLARALTVYPLCFLFSWSRWAIPFRAQHILWWGGLRGALGLALALSLPPSLPFRNEIMVATFGVVTFSVVVQGLTVSAVLRKAASL